MHWGSGGSVPAASCFISGGCSPFYCASHNFGF
ncbi:hypothetical protein HID58_024827 [Brassica napus]|uniref:Uncharacterized protein n=1 Tax=Brassica napus TaxID=3708 RepID=A0ABQ8CK04_BRANA|nr:hypothetical protein HID58_024827 [Brassica napus]